MMTDHPVQAQRLLKALWLAAMLTAGLVLLGACGGDAPEPEAAADRPATSALPAFDPGAFDHLDDGVLKSYLQAQDALVHDRTEATQRALTALASHAQGPVADLARAAAAAEGLAAVRLAFRPLSEAVAKTVLPEGYAVAYCPMAFDYAGGYWVQRKGEIANPYYGARMLRCGVFEAPPGASKK